MASRPVVCCARLFVRRARLLNRVCIAPSSHLGSDSIATAIDITIHVVVITSASPQQHCCFDARTGHRFFRSSEPTYILAQLLATIH